MVEGGQQKTPFAAVSTPETSLSLSSRELSSVPAHVFARPAYAATLTSLDLSRNRLSSLPDGLAQLTALTTLDVSRNKLRALPPALGQLRRLRALVALSNSLRPLARSLPVEQLASLPALVLLDLRFNDKLKAPARDALRRALPPTVKVRVTVPDPEARRRRRLTALHACDRDATLLQSQLEPHSTPVLRKRLGRVFGVWLHPEECRRAEVMERLLRCHAQRGPRAVRAVRQGYAVRPQLCEALLVELRAWAGAQRRTPRERPTVRAQCYTILRSAAEFSQRDGAKARLAAAKVARHAELWRLARTAMEEADSAYAAQYSALAVTLNFRGSPHIDTQNIGPFYGMALGDFSQGGGQLCVEVSAMETAAVDTRGRLCKVDGRFPHWVAPYDSGDRYSLIFYRTLGEVTPKTTAVFTD